MREVRRQIINVGQQLLESGIGVFKPTAEQYADDYVGHTARGQSGRVERLTLRLAHFVDHVVDLGYDARLHDALAEAELFQDSQTQLLAPAECRIVVTEYNAYI